MIDLRTVKLISLGLLITHVMGCGPKQRGGDAAPANTAPPAGGPICLAGCDRPADASFSFAERTVNVGGNCNIKDASLLDTGTKLLLFHRSDCGSGIQLYVNALDSNYTGSAPTLLSQDCLGSGWPVIDFNFAKGSDRVISFAVCQTSLSAASTYVFATDLTGQKTGSRLFASYSGLDLSRRFPHEYSAAWNEAAGAFGIASSDGTFRRWDRNLASLGGSYPISFAESVTVAVRDSQWFVVDRSSCKRFDTGGVLGCNTALITTGLNVGFDGTRRTYNIYPQQWSFNFDVLNAVNCSFANLGAVVTETSMQPINGIFQSRNFSINDKYLGLTTLDTQNRLLLYVLSQSAPIGKVSTLAVADNISTKLIQPLIINRRIAIPILRDGLLTIAESDKTVN